MFLDKHDAILCTKCARGKQTTVFETESTFWHCTQCKKAILKPRLAPRVRKFTSKFVQLVKEF